MCLELRFDSVVVSISDPPCSFGPFGKVKGRAERRQETILDQHLGSSQHDGRHDDIIPLRNIKLFHMPSNLVQELNDFATFKFNVSQG
jgi:hypothetical protein